jgi:hypothetical protein
MQSSPNRYGGLGLAGITVVSILFINSVVGKLNESRNLI